MRGHLLSGGGELLMAPRRMGTSITNPRPYEGRGWGWGESIRFDRILIGYYRFCLLHP